MCEQKNPGWQELIQSSWCKQEGNKRHSKSEDWFELKVRQFNQDMNQNAYDIRAKTLPTKRNLKKNLVWKLQMRMKPSTSTILYGELLASLRCLPHGYERKSVANPEANQLKKCIAKMRESERHESFAKKLQFQEALTPTDYSRPIDCDPDFDTPSCSTLDSPSPCRELLEALHQVKALVNQIHK